MKSSLIFLVVVCFVISPTSHGFKLNIFTGSNVYRSMMGFYKPAYSGYYYPEYDYYQDYDGKSSLYDSFNYFSDYANKDQNYEDYYTEDSFCWYC